ncbi:MAG: divalent metal cation transporter [Paucimonas sp.]|nr:divalent metal cation transporter [Paucimonas sp.]
MDPGNWATGIAAGSAYGHALLWAVMLSNGVAILLQLLSVRLGIATGLDLAENCRRDASRVSTIVQWLAAEIAICATDLAEVIGTAIALNLLFGIPMAWGVALTLLDVLLIVFFQRRGLRYLEAFIAALLVLVFLCFTVNLALAQPAWQQVMSGLVPRPAVLTDPMMLYLAIGILGATVMPHNLYLHSHTVQSRQYSRNDAGRRNAISFASVDIVLALLFALLVNGAILVTAASVFHRNGHTGVAELQDAYHLLAPLLGSATASLLFGVALLASGQASTITATMAGQVVMEGFLQLKIKPWARRLLTRSVAVVPAMAVTLLAGPSATGKLLILSQVILSLQLPFAVVPLVRFTSDPARMGKFVNPRWVTRLAWGVTGLLVAVNAVVLVNLLRGA